LNPHRYKNVKALKQLPTTGLRLQSKKIYRFKNIDAKKDGHRNESMARVFGFSCEYHKFLKGFKSVDMEIHAILNTYAFLAQGSYQKFLA
jgi:hypothetical protein